MAKQNLKDNPAVADLLAKAEAKAEKALNAAVKSAKKESVTIVKSYFTELAAADPSTKEFNKALMSHSKALADLLK
jgi:hypothetical protein